MQPRSTHLPPLNPLLPISLFAFLFKAKYSCENPWSLCTTCGQTSVVYALFVHESRGLGWITVFFGACCVHCSFSSVIVGSDHGMNPSAAIVDERGAGRSEFIQD